MGGKNIATLDSSLTTDFINLFTEASVYIIARVGNQPLFYGANNIIGSTQPTFSDIKFYYLMLFLHVSPNIITKHNTNLDIKIIIFLPFLVSYGVN